MQRRSFLKTASSTAALTFAGLPVHANAKAQDDKTRLLVVLLRGGMDGLTAVPPVGDPQLAKIRPSIDVQRPLALDGSFGLHPRMKYMHDIWQGNQLCIVHSTGFAYTGRSHFEGQDVMQSGVMKPYVSRSGWMGRGLLTAGLQGGVAISIPMPLLLKGDDRAETEFPNWMPPTQQDALKDVMALWSTDASLASYTSALQPSSANVMVGPRMDVAASDTSRSPAALARLAAARLKEELGPRVAVLDMANGFDTHGIQGADTGMHANRLGDFDDMVGAFKQEMGDHWKNTVVVTITEFGRTAAENGTNGTDHGLGSCCFVAGGLIGKSRVIAEWRGLQKQNLFEERDLPTSIDVCAVYAQILERLFPLSAGVIQDKVIAHRPHALLKDMWG